MHCFPCCDLCYEKYINEDGTIDAKTYAELNKKDQNERKKTTNRN